MGYAVAQEAAKMEFEVLTYDFGPFSKDNAVQTCEFKFKNTGTANLVIHQAFASCGCTVPEFTKEPIAPGASGIIKVTYNGTNKSIGIFKKSITVHTNAEPETIRLYVTGQMMDTQEQVDVELKKLEAAKKKEE